MAPQVPSNCEQAGPRAWHIASLSAIAIPLLLGAHIQSKVLLGPDVGWLIRSVRLMSAGHRFGVDIFEPNLPAMWYLCMPAAWGVELFGLMEVDAIRIWIWILTCASLLVVWACLKHSADRSYRLLAELLAAAVAVCILVGPSFGQREHLAFVLSLSYLFVVQLRSRGEVVDSRLAMVTGALGGLAFSIKPVFLVIPLVVEFSMLAFWRRHWRLVRPETVAIGIAGCVSFFGTMALAPDYLKSVVPALYATYWAYDNPIGRVLANYPVSMAVFVGWAAVLLADYRIARSLITWFAAFGAWTASYFFQRRGFDYHGHPATACAFVISLGMLAILAGRVLCTAGRPVAEAKIRSAKLKAVGAAALLMITAQFFASDTRLWFRSTQENWPLSTHTARKVMLASLRTQGVGVGTTVFTFSTNPSPAYPMLNYLGADGAGPDVAQFLLPAWLRREEVRDARRREAIEAAMMIQRRHVSRTLLVEKPDIILVNRWSRSASPAGMRLRRVDYFAIFGEDPAVATELARYRKLAELEGIDVYRRYD